jgi:antitoxin (DNA-binding transcriptional repressor) of toxin-antitoxin stability system
MESTRRTPPAPQRVQVRTFRAQLAHFLNLVCYQGASIYLMRKGKAVARLDPLAEDAEEKILVKNAEKMQDK